MAHQVQPRSAIVTIKLTPDQHKLIDQRAKRCGVRTSVWMRSILLQAASAAPARVGRGEGYLRIREPDGVTT
jgi:hypothetical protein